MLLKNNGVLFAYALTFKAFYILGYGIQPDIKTSVKIIFYFVTFLFYLLQNKFRHYFIALFYTLLIAYISAVKFSVCIALFILCHLLILSQLSSFGIKDGQSRSVVPSTVVSKP